MVGLRKVRSEPHPAAGGGETRRLDIACALMGRPEVVFLDELPRNPTGKILKKELRKPYWEGRDRATV